VLWRTLGALLLGAVVAVGVANAVIALGSDEGPRPPGAIELTPNPDEATEPEQTDGPAGPGEPGDGEPAVVIPPPVHLDPLPAAEPTTPPPPPPPPPPAPTAPAPAPPPDVDDDGDDDDDSDDDDVDDVDDLDDGDD